MQATVGAARTRSTEVQPTRRVAGFGPLRAGGIGLVVALLAACGHGSDAANGTAAGGKAPPTPVHPTDEAGLPLALVASLPAAGAEQTVANVTPMMVFSRGVDPGSAIRAVSLTRSDGMAVAGSVVATGSLVQFKPDAVLTEGAMYTLAASTALTDTARQPLPATASVSFTVVPAAGQVAGKLFVRNGDRTIRVFDAQTQTAIGTIETAEEVGYERPFKADPAGLRVFAANASGQILVIETATHSQLDTITVGSNVVSFDLSPDGSRLYAAVQSPNRLLTFDIGTGAPIGSVALPGYGYNVDVSPDGSFAYVATDETLLPVDLASGTLGTAIPNIRATSISDQIAFHPSLPVAYAFGYDPVTYRTRLVRIDTTTHQATTGPSVMDMEFQWLSLPTSGDRLQLRRVQNGLSTLTTFDPTSLQQGATVQGGFIGSGGWWYEKSGVIDPGGTRLFSGDRISGQVQVIEVATGRVLAMFGAIDSNRPIDVVFIPAAP